jgi:hypothetical protein
LRQGGFGRASQLGERILNPESHAVPRHAAASGFRDFARNDSQGRFAPFVCNNAPEASDAWNKRKMMKNG